MGTLWTKTILTINWSEYWTMKAEKNYRKGINLENEPDRTENSPLMMMNFFLTNC